MIKAFLASMRYRDPSQALIPIVQRHHIDQLDGRGLALLVKQMASLGMSTEAWAIFDFFRQHPPSQDGNCDVFAYTVSFEALKCLMSPVCSVWSLKDHR